MKILVNYLFMLGQNQEEKGKQGDDRGKVPLLSLSGYLPFRPHGQLAVIG